MTYRAVLDDGQEHKPLFLAMTNQMTYKEVDRLYRGAIGSCPDCEQRLLNTDLSDGGSFAAAVASKDRRVSYRCACYDPMQQAPVRQMHFSHRPGYRSDGIIPPCSNINRAVHRETVEAIAHHYRNGLPEGFRVEAECQFVKPGTPPDTYRPDIVVFNQFGGRYQCMEYQRSPESLESLIRRHQIRGAEWGRVVWFFDRKIYDRHSTLEARDWLFHHQQEFWCCWTDPDTLQLHAMEGTFGRRVLTPSQNKKIRQFVPRPCSDAELMKALDAVMDREAKRRRAEAAEPVPDPLAGMNIVRHGEAAKTAEQALYSHVQDSLRQAKEAARRAKEERQRIDRERQERQAQREAEQAARQAELQRIAVAQAIENRSRSTQQIAAQSAAQEAYRAEQQRLAAERQAQWERERAAAAERLRIQQLEDAQWQPIRLSPPVRGRRHSIRLALNLKPGDLIRRKPGAIAEVYQGRSGAGYSTDRYTHLSLEGWQVKRTNNEQLPTIAVA